MKHYFFRRHTRMERAIPRAWETRYE